jgi:phosphoglycerate dehydrogenase-like enzyme
MRILVSIYSEHRPWNIPDDEVNRLRRVFPHHEFVHARDADETLSLIEPVEVAFSSLVRADALARATRLRWLHSPAAGVASLIYPEMLASSVVLTNSRGMHAEAMAEHVAGAIILMLHKFHEAARCQAAHRWGLDELTAGLPIRLMRGTRVGVIGPGAIGSRITSQVAALGAIVEVVRRRPSLGAPPGARAVFSPDKLRDRLPEWDVVVLAAPLTNETRGMIGAAELAAMKPDAILVNVGRGKLVREQDLIDALREHRIAGAALDVVEHEPLDPASPLWDLSNVFITPHTSGLRADYWEIATNLFIDNLRRFDAGEALINVVDKRAGY